MSHLQTNQTRKCDCCLTTHSVQWRKGPHRFDVLCNKCCLRWKRGSLKLQAGDSEGVELRRAENKEEEEQQEQIEEQVEDEERADKKPKMGAHKKIRETRAKAVNQIQLPPPRRTTQKSAAAVVVKPKQTTASVKKKKSAKRAPKRAKSRSNRAPAKPPASLIPAKKDDEADGDEYDYEYSEDEDPTKVYCYCRKRYDPNLFYIQCDGCDEWYHGICANMKEEEAERIFLWFCRICERDSGRRPVFKKFCAGWLAGETFREQSLLLEQQLQPFKQQQQHHSFGPSAVGERLTPETDATTPSISDSPESPPPIADSPESPPPTPDFVEYEHLDFIDIEGLTEEASESINIEAISVPQSPLPVAVNPQQPENQEPRASKETTTNANADKIYNHHLNLLQKQHLSHLYQTLPTCLKYLPDPIAPHLLPTEKKTTASSSSAAADSMSTISGGTNSRYCSDVCGKSISYYHLHKSLPSLPIRKHMHPLVKLLAQRNEDLPSLEAFDAIDSDRLKTLWKEKRTAKQWVQVWEEGRKLIDLCVFRKKAVNYFLGAAASRMGNDDDKENSLIAGEEELVVRKKSSKRKKRRKNRTEDDGELAVADEGTTNAGVAEICGFDTRIVDVWLKRIDSGEALENGVLVISDNDSVNEENEADGLGGRLADPVYGLDLDALSSASTMLEVQNAVLPTMCSTPGDRCKCHIDWEELRLQEVDAHIELLMEKVGEIVAEETTIVDRMRKRRTLMALTL
ncbi:hypothetical protein BDR26DRAFT_854934 [Obelidium mucronatum]|nr:hypothetical protein BDR26DRAFT_854934 [Obelidium mucronatum]